MGELIENSIFWLFPCPVGCQLVALIEMHPRAQQHRVQGRGNACWEAFPASSWMEQQQIGGENLKSKQKALVTALGASSCTGRIQGSFSCIVNQLQNS